MDYHLRLPDVPGRLSRQAENETRDRIILPYAPDQGTQVQPQGIHCPGMDANTEFAGDAVESGPVWTGLRMTPSEVHTSHPRLMPSVPMDFDGSRAAGRAFLTSCKLYFDACGPQLADDNTRIQITLSYMRMGRAATFVERVMRKASLDPNGKAFPNWKAFEQEFRSRFYSRDEQDAVLVTLEGTGYFQNQRPVDEYIDQFLELIMEAGYTQGRTLVMKFRHGLDENLHDRITRMGFDLPHYEDTTA